MKKKYLYYVSTFLITLALLSIIYFASNANGNTIVLSDSRSQYYPLLIKLQNILRGKDTFFYTFNGGLGYNFLGTFFYYLSSPFNLLLLFIDDVLNYMLIATALKLSLTSVFALMFFRYHFKDERVFTQILFSIIYTFIGYNILYSFNIMWLDGIMIFPLVLLGIDKYIDTKKIWIYAFTIFYTIVTNYYIGFMVCLFSPLYFLYRYIINNSNYKNLIKDTFIFGIQMILIVLTTSFVLLEVIHYLPGYARMQTVDNGLKIYNPLNIITGLLIGHNNNIEFLNTENFYIYMGLLTIPLIFLYFLNKDISKKEKFLTLIFFIIFLFSISFNVINYIWTGLSKPQCFNGRFTFMFSFLFIFISLKSLIKLKKNNMQFILLSILLLIIISANYLMTKDAIITLENAFFFIIYTIILFNIDKDILPYTIVLFVAVCIELEVCSLQSLNEYYYISKSEIEEYEYNMNDILNNIEDSNKFYRVNCNGNDMDNTSINFNFNNIDIFLSTLSNSTSDFMIDIGHSSILTTKNTIQYTSSNELMDDLLGIKYHIIDDKYYIPLDYEYINSNDNYMLYKNNDSLSLGYMVNKNILSVEKEENALNYQNNIIKSMIPNLHDVYEQIDIKEIETENNSEIKFEFQNTNYLPVCFYTVIDPNELYDSYQLFLNDYEVNKPTDLELVCTYNPNQKHNKISYYNANKETWLGTYAAYYSNDNLKEYIRELKKNELEITYFKPDYIKGTITSTNNKNILFTSIEYDDNWNILVDGKRVKNIKLLGNLLGAEIENGTHEIELIYKPKEFYLGILISIISSLFFVLYNKKKVYTK